MKTQLSIQERLKDPRVEKGMTLEQLSHQTEIPASTPGSYESDDYKEISHRNLIVLTKFYDVSTDYLLGLTENRQLDNINALIFFKLMVFSTFTLYPFFTSIFPHSTSTVPFRTVCQGHNKTS